MLTTLTRFGFYLAEDAWFKWEKAVEEGREYRARQALPRIESDLALINRLLKTYERTARR